jgi:DNA-binding protein YbaB
MTKPSDMETLVVREARAIREKATAVQKAMAAIIVRMSARGGELEVTVDAAGRTTGIQLTPKAMKLGERQLAQVLLETLARAQRRAEKEAARAAIPLTSDRRVADTLTKIHAVIDADRTPATERRRMTPEEMDDDYFTNQRWLDDWKR